MCVIEHQHDMRHAGTAFFLLLHFPALPVSPSFSLCVAVFLMSATWLRVGGSDQFAKNWFRVSAKDKEHDFLHFVHAAPTPRSSCSHLIWRPACLLLVLLRLEWATWWEGERNCNWLMQVIERTRWWESLSSGDFRSNFILSSLSSDHCTSFSSSCLYFPLVSSPSSFPGNACRVKIVFVVR